MPTTLCGILLAERRGMKRLAAMLAATGGYTALARKLDRAGGYWMALNGPMFIIGAAEFPTDAALDGLELASRWLSLRKAPAAQLDRVCLANRGSVGEARIADSSQAQCVNCFRARRRRNTDGREETCRSFL